MHEIPIFFFFFHSNNKNRFGFLPHRIPLNIVVGSPIKVVKNEKPSQMEIDNLHQEYCEALENLYEKFNPIHGNEKVKLEIV